MISYERGCCSIGHSIFSLLYMYFPFFFFCYNLYIYYFIFWLIYLYSTFTIALEVWYYILCPTREHAGFAHVELAMPADRTVKSPPRVQNSLTVIIAVEKPCFIYHVYHYGHGWFVNIFMGDAHNQLLCVFTQHVLSWDRV